MVTDKDYAITGQGKNSDGEKRACEIMISPNGLHRIFT